MSGTGRRSGKRKTEELRRKNSKETRVREVEGEKCREPFIAA